jgi:hypothetical protein
VTFRGIESKIPNRIKVESTWARLNIAPITTDVEDVDEWQTRHFFYVLLQGFSPGTGRERWTVFLPGVADQPEARVSKRLLRGRCEQHGLPSLVLIDIERALIQALAHGWARSKLRALPKMRRYVRERSQRW